jgi:hypothetical protein
MGKLTSYSVLHIYMGPCVVNEAGRLEDPSGGASGMRTPGTGAEQACVE